MLIIEIDSIMIQLGMSGSMFDSCVYVFFTELSLMPEIMIDIIIQCLIMQQLTTVQHYKGLL